MRKEMYLCDACGKETHLDTICVAVDRKLDAAGSIVRVKLDPSLILEVKRGKNKISDQEVSQVRELLKYGFRQYEIAKMYGVSQGVISKIDQRKSRTYVA